MCVSHSHLDISEEVNVCVSHSHLDISEEVNVCVSHSHLDISEEVNVCVSHSHLDISEEVNVCVQNLKNVEDNVNLNIRSKLQLIVEQLQLALMNMKHRRYFPNLLSFCNSWKMHHPIFISRYEASFC